MQSHGATGKGNDQVRFELGYHYFWTQYKNYSSMENLEIKIKNRSYQLCKKTWNNFKR